MTSENKRLAPQFRPQSLRILPYFSLLSLISLSIRSRLDVLARKCEAGSAAPRIHTGDDVGCDHGHTQHPDVSVSDKRRNQKQSRVGGYLNVVLAAYASAKKNWIIGFSSTRCLISLHAFYSKRHSHAHQQNRHANTL